MKYVLYIDYRASYKPMYSEYRPMNAKTMAEAVIEADATHDSETMYFDGSMTALEMQEMLRTRFGFGLAESLVITAALVKAGANLK